LIKVIQKKISCSVETIYIPQLTRAPQQTEAIAFAEMIPGLESLTPVRGQIQVKHCNNYLEIAAAAETIVTLTCHRCLQQYNYRLSIQPTELIWLEEKPDDSPLPFLEASSADELVETLSPNGYFDPTTWIYEQLCLELPQQQLCEAACQGIEISKTAKSEPDQRWASLEALRQQLPDYN
jgi:uncharacterized protein